MVVLTELAGKVTSAKCDPAVADPAPGKSVAQVAGSPGVFVAPIAVGLLDGVLPEAGVLVAWRLTVPVEPHANRAMATPAMISKFLRAGDIKMAPNGWEKRKFILHPVFL